MSLPINTELYNIKWTKEPVETLGIVINGKEDDHLLLNFKNKIKRINNLLLQWKKRKLSLKGRIIVINTLVLPQIYYLSSCIYTPVEIIKDF